MMLLHRERRTRCDALRQPGKRLYVAEQQKYDQHENDKADTAYRPGTPPSAIAVTTAAKQKDDQNNDDQRGGAHAMPSVELRVNSKIAQSCVCNRLAATPTPFGDTPVLP